MEFLELLQQEQYRTQRTLVANVEPLSEAAGNTYSPSTGNLTLTIIKPGWSKNNRYYSAALLKTSAPIFESCKMFVDHATDAQEKARPEGSIKDWVGTITGVKAMSDGTVRATANVHQEAFKTTLDNLKKAGNLSQMGISIRAFGEARDGEAEGRKGLLVESLIRCRSVDFVTFAAAGGQVEMLEAADDEEKSWLSDNTSKVEVCGKGDKIIIDYWLSTGRITEAEHYKLTTGRPVEYKDLSEQQRKEYDFSRAIGINESDALKLVKITSSRR